MGGFSTVSGNPTVHRKRTTTKFSFVMVTRSFLRASVSSFAIDLSVIDHTAETPESETSVKIGKKKIFNSKTDHEALAAAINRSDDELPGC